VIVIVFREAGTVDCSMNWLQFHFHCRSPLKLPE